MNIIMQEGRSIALPGCLARFGADLGIVSPDCELTHVIKSGRLFKITGPAGCKREQLGIIERIEV